MDTFDELFVRNGFDTPSWSGVGVGWYSLLDRLLLDLRLLDVNDKITLEQVKEKYGGLRFYWSPARYAPRGNELWLVGELKDNALYHAVSDRIREAETESERTCELCGEPGTLSSKGGWFRTVCPNEPGYTPLNDTQKEP